MGFEYNKLYLDIKKRLSLIKIKLLYNDISENYITEKLDILFKELDERYSENKYLDNLESEVTKLELLIK